MIGVALLGGTACFTSRVGPDDHGRLYREHLAKLGVKPNPGGGGGDTGICLVLITPDAERTMCTFLGTARDLEPRDVDLDDLRASRYLYVTGYLWDTDTQKEAVTLAMTEANKAGVKVSFSLSDPFCVGRHKEDFLKLVKGHVDVVFANDEEAMALTDTECAEDAARALASLSGGLAAVTMNSAGSLLCRGDEMVQVPIYPVQPVDTTGAGDMYAAGVLYGLTQGYSLEVTGRIAAYAAAQVVAKLGPRLSEIDREAIEVIKSEL
jgi:sugar/nucleoside kinase (ribokinase family)